MSMRLSYLRTYLSPDEADTIMTFLDELKDVLWASYGADIIEGRQRLEQHKKVGHDSSDDESDGFDEMTPF